MKWEIFIKNCRKIRIYKAQICLRRQADDSPSPHVDKRRHLTNSPPIPLTCLRSLCMAPKQIKESLELTINKLQLSNSVPYFYTYPHICK